MKSLFLIFLALFAFQISAQNELTTSQWEEDLRHLQITVHKDYPFLFKKTTKENFDKAVEELSTKIPTLESHEIIVGLAKIVSSFKYGHTALGFRQNSDAFHQLPINFYLFNNGLYIQGGQKDYEAAVGAKVLKIGSKTAEQVMKAIYPVVPVENEQYFKAYGLRYLQIPEVLHAQGVIDSLSQNIEFTLLKGGKTFTQVIRSLPSGEKLKTSYGFVFGDENLVDARNESEVPYYLKNLDKIYYYEYLPEQKTVYVRHSQIQDDPTEDIPTFYKGVFDFINNNDVDRLVLDVRLNGGGNNYKNKPVITGIIETEKINKVGKLFVILGRRTFSACQNLVNELDNYTNAIFVGEPTSENVNFYGDNNRVELPNSKIPVFLSFAWWQDKPQWEGDEWLAPHIAVDMSFAEFINNEDPVLDAALQFDADDFIKDPMQYLTSLFEKGEIEKLKSETVKLVKDPRYKFFDFEAEFNSAGYRLLQGGRHKEAIFVFEMNTQLFPDSPNAWDSLAEGYLNSGDSKKATELYNKVVNMDPSGRTGDNARNMLLKIKEVGAHKE